MTTPAVTRPLTGPARVDLSLAHFVYCLQVVTVVLAFTIADELTTWLLCAVPSMIGVVLNYARRDAVRETFLASHFHWQIRTFWTALLWITAAILVSMPLAPLLIGFFIAVAAGLVVLAWMSYRVIRGWICLARGLPIYA